MSTDDLVRRARAAARGLKPTTPGTSALVSELADEVDRLRGEADRYRTLWDRHGKNDLLAERDAARAALERVRAKAQAWAAKAPEDDWADDIGDTMLADAGRDVLTALEGEPS